MIALAYIDSYQTKSQHTIIMQNTKSFPVIPVVIGAVVLLRIVLFFGMNKSKSEPSATDNSSISTALTSGGSNFASRFATSNLKVPNGYPSITILPGSYLGTSENYGTDAKPNYAIYYKADKSKLSIKQAAEHYIEEFKKQGFSMESIKERPYGEVTSFSSYGTKDRGDVSVQSYVDLINTDEVTVTVFLHPNGLYCFC
jgi:hypothetical protein